MPPQSSYCCWWCRCCVIGIVLPCLAWPSDGEGGRLVDGGGRGSAIHASKCYQSHHLLYFCDPASIHPIGIVFDVLISAEIALWAGGT